MSCKRSRGLHSSLSGGLSPMAQEDLGSTTAHSKCFLSPQVLQSDLGRTKNQPIKIDLERTLKIIIGSNG